MYKLLTNSFSPDNARAHLGPTFGNVTNSYILDDVDCDGDEDDIFDCDHGGVNQHDCSISEGAGVSCLQDTPPPPTR